jgi:ribokinase
LPDELLALTDLLAPNETELELLCRRPAGSVEDLQGSAEMLRNRGAAAVAVTLGERGALLVDASGATPIPPYRVNAVDPTGAGDAFSGSLAVFWAEGLTLLQAAGRASAVAALAVTRLGAQSAFPTREEFERFMAK